MYIEGINPKQVWDPLTQLESPAPFALGTRGLDQDGKEYVWLQVSANGSAAIGLTGFFNDLWVWDSVALADDAANQRLAVSPVAATVGQRAWFQRYGQSEVQVTAGTTIGGPLGATAVVGVVGNDAAGSFRIAGMASMEAAAAPPLTTTSWLQYPMAAGVAT